MSFLSSSPLTKYRTKEILVQYKKGYGLINKVECKTRQLLEQWRWEQHQGDPQRTAYHPSDLNQSHNLYKLYTDKFITGFKVLRHEEDQKTLLIRKGHDTFMDFKSVVLMTIYKSQLGQMTQ